MGDPGPVKLCRICGESCAGQPRTRDPQGHYYHQSCYDDTKLNIAARDALASSALDIAVPGIDAAPEPDSRSLLSELIEDSAAAPQTDAVQHCPGCGLPLAPDDLICSTCSFDLRPQAIAATAARVASARAGSLWPSVIGSISAIAGGLGSLVFAPFIYGAFKAAPWESSTLVSMVILLSSLFPFLMSLWLAMAGVGIARRRSTAPSFVWRWAIWMIVVASLIAGIALLLRSGAMSDRAVLEDPDVRDTLDRVFTLIIFGAFGLLAWPIFVLVWFGRRTIRTQTADW